MLDGGGDGVGVGVGDGSGDGDGVLLEWQCQSPPSLLDVSSGPLPELLAKLLLSFNLAALLKKLRA